MACVLEVRNEIYRCLNEEGHSTAHLCVDCDFSTHLGYLSDAIFKLETLTHRHQFVSLLVEHGAAVEYLHPWANLTSHRKVVKITFFKLMAI